MDPLYVKLLGVGVFSSIDPCKRAMVTFRSSQGCSRSQGISLALSNLSHLWPRHAQSTWHKAQSGSRCIIPEKVCEFETIYI